MVRPIVPPTVPEGTQRVRVCLHAGNTLGDVEKLVRCIGRWLELKEEDEERGLQGERTSIGLVKSLL
jgi:8-amino-7-oxononanoate synthase